MDSLLLTKGKRPRTGAVRECEACGKRFYCQPSQTERRRYCSCSCKVQGQLKKKLRRCGHCGIEYEKHRKSTARFCSWHCYYLSRKPNKSCEVCGNTVALSRYRFCSQQCFLRRPRKGKQKACEQCGKSIWVEPHQINKRFCSRNCLTESKRLKGPGAKHKRADGYIAVYYPTHPDCKAQGFILEHRLVAEQKYGRRILKSEQVHHLNHIRDDNRPENLEVISPSDHSRISNARGKSLRQAMKAELEEYRRRFGPLT